jgi:TadE-like protein
MTMPKPSRRGNALLEFTLIGIPLLFVLISIFEISRGMWIYDTLAHAVKDTNRFVIVKGENCVATGNACGVTVQRIAEEFRDLGVGLIPADANLSLIALDHQVDCFPLSNCLAGGSHADIALPWPTRTTPPATGSGRGQNITVRATMPFRSALAFFWPGAGPGFTFGVFNLGATSTEKIQF